MQHVLIHLRAVVRDGADGVATADQPSDVFASEPNGCEHGHLRALLN